MAASDTDKQVPVVLLVGRSGNGKASCVKSVSSVDSVALKLVKCEDVGDNEGDITKDNDTVLENTKALVKELESDYGGIDAIALVLKYGVRFTKQEKDAVTIVRSVFGDDVFQKWGILIFTHGDLFANDMDTHDLPNEHFKDWCMKQRGDIQTLFDEVFNRCVLFDNKIKDKKEISKQIELLSEYVKSISQTSSKYRTPNINSRPISDEHMGSSNRNTQNNNLFLSFIIQLCNRILQLCKCLPCRRPWASRVNPEIEIVKYSKRPNDEDSIEIVVVK